MANNEKTIETAKYFDISLHDARNTVADFQKTICGNWRALAANNGLSKSAIARMEPAFNMEYK